MKHFLLTSIFILIFNICYSQNDSIMYINWSNDTILLYKVNTQDKDSTIIIAKDRYFNYKKKKYYFKPDIYPSFSDNYDCFVNYTNKNIKENLSFDYPFRMIVCFFIDKNGKIDNVFVSYSTGDPYYNLLVVEKLKQMPKWNPAYIDNKKINSIIFIPVNMQ